MMIKYIMNKFIFHNSKLNTENFKIKNSFLNPRTNIKSIVDINTLLNKVRLEKKSEKKKIIFLGLGTLSLFFSVSLLLFII